MNEANVISPEELLAVTEEDGVQYNQIQWRTLNITIRSLISLREMSMLIDSIMSACVDLERDILFPEALDLAYRVGIILSYTNIKLPVDAEEHCRILYSTDLFDVVCEKINHNQISAIQKAIEICLMNK